MVFFNFWAFENFWVVCTSCLLQVLSWPTFLIFWFFSWKRHRPSWRCFLHRFSRGWSTLSTGIKPYISSRSRRNSKVKCNSILPVEVCLWVSWCLRSLPAAEDGAGSRKRWRAIRAWLLFCSKVCACKRALIVVSCLDMSATSLIGRIITRTIWGSRGWALWWS